MSLGSTLREARERKGLTIAEVAEQTRMIHQLVEEIEKDDFHRISAPIYGRGFVKLFAECVDEDPAPLMQEFTEIYTGLRRPGVRTRPVQTPVEEKDVEEPKDRNAPPPRPKVRAVVVADDDAAPSEPVESPKSKVEVLAETKRDTPVVSAPVESPKSKVESLANIGSDMPVTSAMVEGPKSIVEGPMDNVTAAPTARPAEPVESPKSKVESPTDVAPPSKSPESSTTDLQPSAKSEEQASKQSDENLLGELFDLVARKRAKNSDELPSEKHDDKDVSPVKISLPQPAPSWNDAPLEEEGDFWQKIYNLDKWKYWKVGAALAGVCLLAVIVFGIVANRHSKPEEAEPPVVSQTTAISEPQPEPQPEQAPAELSTLNSQLPTSSAENAVASPADGRTVYTANLIPPPDSYVE